MGECTSRLRWVECPEPPHRFKPRRLRAAITPEGVYEVFEQGAYFDAWFVKTENRVLVYLGTSQTANGAREKCERHAQKGRT